MSFKGLVVPAFAAAVVAVILVPLPWWLLDVLIAFNISLSLVLVLLVSSAGRPADLGSFPAAVLLATLLRVALNVASTRLILTRGYAGQVIERFGEFVAGGNPVLGFVMFLIITVVQFVVVTRGAERVAEVAARFTLDAMPGRQMSVDADLNAGLITEEEARRRREEIRREADFYGAMDGASRFVRGDAVAGLVIVAVNLLGGTLSGVLFGRMSAGEALARYALLAIGDGLSAQIPALLVSAAAGIAVTRAASAGDLSSSLVREAASHPAALAGAGALFCAVGLVPGMAHAPMLAVGGLLLGLGLYARRLAAPAPAAEEAAPAAPSFEDLYRSCLPDAVAVELGAALLQYADPGRPGGLPERVRQLRARFASEMGVVLPPVRIKESAALKATAYAILVRGVEAGRGEVLPGHVLAVSAGPAGEIPGIPAHDPAFGLPALWVAEERRAEAEVAGWTVVDPVSVIVTHLVEVLRRCLHELIDRQEVQNMLDAVRKAYPALVDELVPGVLSAAEVEEVLRALVREGVPLTDVAGVLDALGRAARVSKDTAHLVREARKSLYRLLTRSSGLADGAPVLVFDPALERRLVEAALRAPGGVPALEPDFAGKLVDAVAAKVRQVAVGRVPVFVCPGEVREFVRAVVERVSPRIPVLSYQEVDPQVELRPAGVVRVDV